MFNILVYLFETSVHNESKISMNYDVMIRDLSNIGFSRKDIYNALRWLKHLSYYKKNIISFNRLSLKNIAIRIYTQKELIKLNVECRGFILLLEQLEILTLDIREMIIEGIMALDITELNLEDLKWIILIVLFSVSGYEEYYQKLKNLLFNFNETLIH